MSESESPEEPRSKQHERTWMLLLGCWIVATGSALGSLFFSEIMELPPCSLCWYQRCFMFPLAIVLLVGVLSTYRGVVRYALPLAVGGWLLASYHVLVHIGAIPKGATPCQQGVSCSDIQFELFGVFSIPMLSFLSFTAVTVMLVVARRSQRDD